MYFFQNAVSASYSFIHSRNKYFSEPHKLLWVGTGGGFMKNWEWKGGRDVVVNFLSRVIFVFLLFLGMVMYANEVETKEK